MNNDVKREYLGAKELKTMLGISSPNAYEKIKEFNCILHERYPNVYLFDTKIPIWFWDELTKPKERKDDYER